MKIWIEIDEARLAANFHALDHLLSAAKPEPVPAANPAANPALLAVVKANAYGHGIAACVPTLARAGAEWLGVTDTHEGIAVRQALERAGIPAATQPHILIMSGLEGTRAEAEAILTHRLTPVVWTPDQLRPIAAAALRLGHTAAVPVHLEIDTGMARQGVQPGPALDAMLSALAATSAITLEGFFTHFASTEVLHSRQTADQRLRFEAAIAQLEPSGLQPRWLHVGNSSYLDNGAEPTSLSWLYQLAASLNARPMIRSGLGLYGYLLPLEAEPSEATNTPANPPAPPTLAAPLAAPSVQPVLAWKTHVIGLRDLSPAETIGYNGIYVAERPMRLALLPVGYADGLRRELSAANDRPGGWVILRGQRAPIVGRVSMNLTVVDVTAIPSVQVGDEATLLGDGVTASDHARLAHTIAYEILCNIKTSACD